MFGIDFVADGPHGLVGGTTGSGKSELLRSMVAGLAASVDPDHLTFVLIDFKGGSAFDECARLPHTVGMVTDLDEHLAERALRCLEAELKHRERALRDAGAVDLPDYLRGGAARAAAPAARGHRRVRHPHGRAARVHRRAGRRGPAGRSLGVHMLLATQRPQGAISDNIGANTNLRIALGCKEDGDSTDVIDVPDAAGIPARPGPGYVPAWEPGEVVAIQTALSTGVRAAVGGAARRGPFVYGPEPRRPSAAVPPAPPLEPGATRATRHRPVAAGRSHQARRSPARAARPAPPLARSAARRRRPRPADRPRLAAGRPGADPGGLECAPGPGRRPRRPDPVPDGLVAGGGQPHRLRHRRQRHDDDADQPGPGRWPGCTRPTTSTSTLSTSAPASWVALEPLPHVGAVIMANERERQTRLIRHLRAELDRRRAWGRSRSARSR